MGNEATNLQITNLQELQGMSSALNRVQAIIEFDLKGKVLGANENFLDLLGYKLEQVVGSITVYSAIPPM